MPDDGHRPERDLSGAFAGRPLPNDDPRGPRVVEGDWPVLACTFDLGKIGPRPSRGMSSSPMTTSIRSNIWAFGCVPIGGASRTEAADLLRRATADYADLAQHAAFDEC